MMRVRVEIGTDVSEKEIVLRTNEYDAEGIARKLVYPPDEIHHEYILAPLVAERKCHGIGINHYLATIEKIAVNPIHYHPVALFQMRRETPGGHREDSECIGSHRPYQEQRQA